MSYLEHKTRILNVCPWCRTSYDATSAYQGEHGPSDGDVTLCIECGEWAVFAFAVEGHLRKPTDDEQIEIGMNKDGRSLREAWMRMKKSREVKIGGSKP